MKYIISIIAAILTSASSFAQTEQHIYKSDGSLFQHPVSGIDSINFSGVPPRMHLYQRDSITKNIFLSEIDSVKFNGFEWGEALKIPLAGQVFDEDGQAVFGVQVHAGSVTALTDSNGVFYFPSAAVSENLGYIRAYKNGYFPGLCSFLPTQGANRVEIRLLRKNIAGSFSSSAGGTVQREGVSISFPANGFVRNGSAYSGSVNVALNYIDPESEHFDAEMPGNLLGMMNGNVRFLTSYGMIAGELTDNAGNILEFAPGVTAQVRFPLSAGLLATAPETIDFWHFDEETGLWSHEGLATKEGNEYLASVSHFSFWNCDVPFPAVLLRGRVVDENGAGVQGAKVTLTSSSRGTASGITTSSGHFGGYVPANEVLNIRVGLVCESGTVTQEVYFGSIGPFADSTSYPAIQINTDGLIKIFGTITNCDSVPVHYGYVMAGGNSYFTNSTGRFSFYTCGDSISIRAYSLLPWSASVLFNLSLTLNSIDMGLIYACGELVGTVGDIDGNSYRTVKIGTQEWMAENLNTAHYQDGSEIPNLIPDSSWNTLNSGAWSYFNHSSDSGAIYGKLYNWYAIADPRGLCPAGWHVPTEQEWAALIEYLGGIFLAGDKMKTSDGWQDYQGASNNGTNQSGFSALPGGFRGDGHEGVTGFGFIGITGNWWSASVSYGFKLNSYNGFVTRIDFGARAGMSVRCVRD